MHEYFAQQAAAQMPQVACPDVLDRTAVHELAKDGINAVAHATESSTPARSGVMLGATIGSQQRDTVPLPLSGGYRRPVVAAAYQRAGGLLGQRGERRQLVNIGGRHIEPGDNPRPFEAHMHPQPIEGLAHQRVLAKGGLPPKAATAMRPGELADQQRQIIHNGERGVMWRHAEQPLLRMLQW